MRILVLSNLYPPYYLGGYELACKDIVEGLRNRGHTIFVLTSTYGINKYIMQNQVCRSLHFYWFDPLLPIWKFTWTQFWGGHYIAHTIRTFSPDIVYVWNMAQLGQPMLRTLTQSYITRLDKKQNEHYNYSIPIVFAIFDRWLLYLDGQSQHWIDYWKHIPRNSLKQRLKLIVKRIVSHYLPVIPLEFQITYAHFFSRLLQQQHADAGILPEHSQVIYFGVPIKNSNNPPSLSDHRDRKEPVKLLYCGQLLETKGVHTAIEAVAVLVHQRKLRNIHLTIIGPQPFPDYVTYLHMLIEKHQLQQIVTIRNGVPREQIESVYNNHDFLIFPSIWKEPFGITILEAMAHGLVVLSTPTGGNTEVLRDGENCLIFPPEAADKLADRIAMLMHDHELVRHIQRIAVKTVQSQYSLKKTIDTIERDLTRILNDNSSNP